MFLVLFNFSTNVQRLILEVLIPFEQDYMQQLTGARSVPRVFIQGKFIGGGDDTARLASTGELKTLLEKAGVPV